MIKLFDIENNVVKATEHCHNIKWLKDIMDTYPDSYLKIYAFLFYMSCPSEENPYFHMVEHERELTVLEDIDADFSTEDELIIEARKKTHLMYETPTVRAYNGLKIALDNIADYMAATSISDGKDGNIGQIRAVAKDFDHIRQSFKGVAKDLADEQETHVRGGQNLAYDD
jgi:hypothetical protein